MYNIYIKISVDKDKPDIFFDGKRIYQKHIDFAQSLAELMQKLKIEPLALNIEVNQ